MVAPGDVGVIAQYIEDRTQADVFKIVVTEPYSANYDEALNQGRTQRDQSARPALASTVENMENYDVIFFGFPNWWYTISVAVHSFVEAYDLSGKTIIPFVTHGTGGLSGTIRDLTVALPDTCTILQSYDAFEDDVTYCFPAVLCSRVSFRFSVSLSVTNPRITEWLRPESVSLDSQHMPPDLSFDRRQFAQNRKSFFGASAA